ncbi:MAG: nitrate- and nitrite sensing domain-containing protein [Arcobacteraceae bacterium]|nr:nitrate- and nitrite sensing domain-containing protein [Arcobacteraceae bacterium]
MYNFFNKLAIITKVNIIFFISIFTILVYTFIQINHNYEIYKNSDEVEKASNVSIVISSLIHELQKERGLSSGYIGSDGLKFSKELQIQTEITDKRIVELKNNIFFVKDKFASLNLSQINKIREEVKKKLIKHDQVIDFYSTINEKMLLFIFETLNHSLGEHLLNEKIFKESLAYLKFLYVKEYLGIQRAVTVNILSKDYIRYKDRSNLIKLITKQQLYIKNFLRHANDESKNRYYKIVESSVFKNSELISQKLLQINKTNKFQIDAVYAFDTFTAKVNLFKTVESFLANKLINDAIQLKREAKYKFFLYSSLSGFIVLFLIIIKHFTGLNIYRTIKRLDKRTYQLNKSLESFDKNVISSHIDKNGLITYVSDAFCNITGYLRKELIGQPCNIIWNKDMSKKLFTDISNMMKTDNIYTGEIKNRKKDGNIFWLEVIISPKFDKKKNIIGFNSIGQEITNKKALENLSNTLELKVKARTEELEKERHFIDTVLNTQEQIVITTDGKVIKSANKAFMKFFNISELKEFTDVHECICETFNKKAPKGYLQIMIDGKKWTQYILDNPNIHHKAMIVKEDIEYIFSVTLSEVEIEEEMLEIVVFSDITQIENAKQEIERKVQEGLVEIKILNEEVTDTQREIVSKMGAICETRSKETGNHVKRVATYSELFAVKYGIDSKEVKLLKEASPMHDIGKVAITDDILNKPGKLTVEEFERMKEHALIGYDMLKDSQRAILKIAAIVSYEHHEKYDGTGYPNRLKGEDIHIYGRITAIADVFDALGSDRCYKKAWNDEKIFQFFKDERGKHFDPKLVDIFFANVDEFLRIREDYRDNFNS